MKCDLSFVILRLDIIIVTGDLKLIEHIKLRNLIAKGPNYREQNNINWYVNM